MDYYIQEDGTILDYKGSDFNLDHLNNGKSLLSLYQITGKEKYKKAIQLLKNQLDHQPMNEEGGYWHKKIYPKSNVVRWFIHGCCILCTIWFRDA